MRDGDQVLRTAAVASLVGGLAGFLVLDLSGQPAAGVALASGLGLGSLNGFLARRTLGLPINFGATSLVRLGLVSAAGLGLALFLYPPVAWLLLLGIGAAQLVLAGCAVKAGLRA